MKHFLCAVSLILGWAVAAVNPVFSQTTFPPHGLHEHTPRVFAFTNCTVVAQPGLTIDNATLIIRDGRIENLGKGIHIPPDAQIRDLKGAWIFPGFIDAWSGYGFDKFKRPGGGRTPQHLSKTEGPYAWNQAVKPEYKLAEALDHKPEAAKKLRSMGFTTVHTVPQDGIFRGLSAVVNLADRPIQKDLLNAEEAACMSFDKGSSRQAYPSSLMGSIALIRQTMLDAVWYAQVQEARASKPGLPESETNLSLEAINRHKKAALPIFFECDDWQNVLRASALAREFDLKFIYKASAARLHRPDAIKDLGSDLVVSLDFPKAFDVKSAEDAREISLGQMLEWELAPMIPGKLAKNKTRFALTLYDLKSEKEFWPSMVKALENGLSPDDALAALTLWPAEILGLEKQTGSLNPGKLANFFIADTNIFAVADPVLYETWVSGIKFSEREVPEWDPSGSYSLSPPQNGIADLLIGGKNGKWTLKVIVGTDTLDGKISVEGRKVDLNFPVAKGKDAARVRLGGLSVSSLLRGSGENAGGDRINWTANRTGDWTDPKEKPHKPIKPADLDKVPAIRFPNKAYGLEAIPPQQTVFIQNVTLWTNTSVGVVEGADVIISEGKIKAVGKNLLRPPKAVIVDGTGKHLSPGIIDEHSHIGVSRGVNEGSHAVTAEVRIGDVINSEDINIYRQLAGGVTTSQLLHGSANPIGGQSAIIKLRWGAEPAAMKFEEAAPFIKFALGENVKQSNWGDEFRDRYPQTRIGVEQLMRDAFTAALDYKKALNATDPVNKLPVRRDLQLETLLEILESKRFVTCHSYQQGEITMLMRLAESFNFRINTFTHVLEGYKVADKMQKHGVTGSTFSDWWAYKFEVIDAIPYNAALMASQGVNVCINSDDAEMGRRLNQEAAKIVKYGGASEEDALKMVTLNPAKALHLDEWVGSIEEGKHADLVLWSDHPLSVYARPLHTYIDGRLYFDAERDAAMQEYVDAERKRLVQKMMADPGKGKKKPAASKEEKLYHCETLESEYNH